jgi:hypothetical protein
LFQNPTNAEFSTRSRLKRPGFCAHLDFADQLIGLLSMIFSFCLGGWPSAEAVHEPLLVVPVNPGCGEGFDVCHRLERAAAKW